MPSQVFPEVERATEPRERPFIYRAAHMTLFILVVAFLWATPLAILFILYSLIFS